MSIKAVMEQEFQISEQEAVVRINKKWRGYDFLDLEDMRYHEEPAFWAYDIDFGPKLPQKILAK